jgi:hypothetical protein
MASGAAEHYRAVITSGLLRRALMAPTAAEHYHVVIVSRLLR